jgi:hypothetical protein
MKEFGPRSSHNSPLTSTMKDFGRRSSPHSPVTSTVKEYGSQGNKIPSLQPTQDELVAIAMQRSSSGNRLQRAFARNGGSFPKQIHKAECCEEEEFAVVSEEEGHFVFDCIQ